MEAARTVFGLGTLSYLHQAPLFLKTSQSLFPRPSLSLKPMKHDFVCVKATTKSSTSDDLESGRPSILFSPSIWGDYFLSVSVDDSVSIWIKRKMFRDPFTSLAAENMIRFYFVFLLFLKKIILDHLFVYLRRNLMT